MLSQRAIHNLSLFLVAWCNVSHAATLTVGKANALCPSAKYDTIGAAVTAAAAGDEIDICPALYPEQVVISKPVTLRGLGANGTQRVLLQPAAMTNAGNLPSQAVITVVNTVDVTIEGLAIDAGNNSVSGCTVSLAGIHFSNSSGKVASSAIFGAQLKDPQSCTTLFPGNGSGVQVDTTSGQTGPFSVSLDHNSIHDFNRNAILAVGSGVTAEIRNNTISGVGPSAGYFQFGVFIANGAVGRITGNMISQGNCGNLASRDCINLRSEGVVFRAAGDGSVVDSNFITTVQSGIFLNGANNAQITNNIIMNVDALDGIDIQGSASGFFTNSVIAGNSISHVGAVNADASNNETGCGINEASGTGVAQNIILNNNVNDAYCGVASVGADQVFSGVYLNTLYATLNADLYPNTYPPAAEP